MTHIVHICGTHGSGKSTVAQAVRERSVPLCDRQFITGRKQPIGYQLHLPGVQSPVMLLGSYESLSGGCDTIKDIPWLFSYIEQLWSEGHHVVYEGSFTMNHTRGLQLWRATRAVTVIRLTPTLDECLARIEARRERAGTKKAYRRSNIEGNYKRAINYCSKMSFAGAPVFKLPTEEATDKVVEVLRS